MTIPRTELLGPALKARFTERLSMGLRPMLPPERLKVTAEGGCATPEWIERTPAVIPLKAAEQVPRGARDDNSQKIPTYRTPRYVGHPPDAFTGTACSLYQKR